DADPDAVKHVDAAQDKDGRLYDSRAGIGGYYRYGPRKIADLYTNSKVIPKIHESVLARIQVGAHLYAPINLPANYAEVRSNDRAIRQLGNDSCESSIAQKNDTKHRNQYGTRSGAGARFIF